MKKKGWKGKLKSTLLFLIFLLLFGLTLGTFIHEFIAHGGTAYIFGGEITDFRISILSKVNGSFSIHPLNIIGGWTYNTFPKYWYEEMTLKWGDYTPLADGFITIMAPIISLLISLTATLFILTKKPKGWRKYLLLVFAIYFIDPLWNFFASDFTYLFNLIGFFYHLPFVIISILVAINSSFIIYMSLRQKFKREKLFKRSIILLYLLVFLYLIYFGFRIYWIYYL